MQRKNWTVLSIGLLAATALISCSDSDAGTEFDPPAIAGTPDAATIESKYQANLTAAQISADLAFLSWLGEDSSQLDQLDEQLENTADSDSTCFIKDFQSSLTQGTASLATSSTWTDANGKSLKICQGDFATIDEYYTLLNRAHIKHVQQGTSDGLDITLQVTGDYRKTGSGSSISLRITESSSMLYTYKTPVPTTIFMQMAEGSTLDAQGDESTQPTNGKIWFMDGTYQCEIRNINDSGIQDAKLCDITHADRIVAEYWQSADENSEDYFIDLDGNRILPSIPAGL